MKATVSSALIGAAVAVVVALITLMRSILSSKAAAELSKEVEIIKHGLEQTSADAQVLNNEFRATLDGLKLVVGEVQKTKDQLQVVLGAVEGSLDGSAAITMMTACRNELFLAYEQACPHLPLQENNACHRAKNTALHIEQVLRHVFGDRPGLEAAALPPDDREQLVRLRMDLSDSQQKLVECRLALLEDFAVRGMRKSTTSLIADSQQRALRGN